MVRCARATSGNPAGYGRRAKLRWFAAVPGMRPHTVRRAAHVTVFLPGKENLERTSLKSERVRKDTETQRHRGPKARSTKALDARLWASVSLCLCVSNHVRFRLFSRTCIDLCAQDESTYKPDLAKSS